MPKKPETKSEEGKTAKDVKFSTLSTLQFFSYKGGVYSKRRGDRALSKEGDSLITLPPDTLVKPV